MGTVKRIASFCRLRWWHPIAFLVIFLFYFAAFPLIKIVFAAELVSEVFRRLRPKKLPEKEIVLFHPARPLLYLVLYIVWREPSLRAFVRVSAFLDKKAPPKKKAGLRALASAFITSLVVVRSTGLPVMLWKHICLLLDSIERSGTVDPSRLASDFISRTRP